MMSAKCEEIIPPGSIANGIKVSIRTLNGRTPDCNISKRGPDYTLTIENHSVVPYGVKFECESIGNHVEFGDNGGYDTFWEGSIFVDKRLGSKPGIETVQLDTRPCHSKSVRNRKINTKLNFTKISITANPDVDRSIKVDIN